MKKFVKISRGVISVFLAILMLPIISLCGVLVEAERYQNAKAMMEEIMNSASLSVMGNYDRFLLDRFGLLSMNQDSEPQALYQQYVDGCLNIGQDGSPMKLTAAVQGLYSLTDKEVLERQILEFEKYRGPTNLLYSSFDISQLAKALRGNLTKAENVASQIETGAKAMTACADVVTKADALCTAYDKLEKRLKENDEAYNHFQEAVDALIAHLKATEDDGLDTAVLLQAVNTTKEAYSGASGTLKDLSSGTPNNLIETFILKTQAAADSVAKAEESVGKVPDGGDSTAGKVLNSSIKGLKELLNATKDVIGVVNQSALKQDQKTYQAVRDKVTAFSAEAVTAETTPISESDGFKHDLSGIIDKSKIKTLVSALKKKMKVSDDGKSSLKSTKSFLEELNKLKTFYDARYDASLKDETSGSLPEGNPGGCALRSSAKVMTNSFSYLMKAVKYFMKASGLLAPYYLALGIMYAGIGLAMFAVALVGFVINLVTGIVTLVTTNFMKNAYISQYILDQTPNRLNRDTTKKSLKLEPVKGGASATFSMFDFEPKVKSHPATTFCGCEQEYVLGSSKYETENQAQVFMMIFCMRLALDAVPVLNNGATSALYDIPYVGWVIYVLFLLIEGFADTILIVNGRKLPIYKSEVFVSPSGLKTLMSELKAAVTSSKKTEEDNRTFDQRIQDYKAGLLKFGYEDYTLLFLLLTKNDNKLGAIENIVQMDTAYNKGLGNEGHGFKLEKAYTYIQADVTGQLKTVMPLPNISANPFSLKNTQYRGY